MSFTCGKSESVKLRSRTREFSKMVQHTFRELYGGPWMLHELFIVDDNNLYIYCIRFTRIKEYSMLNFILDISIKRQRTKGLYWV